MANHTLLAIESSCDETSAAVLVGPRDVRSSVVSSQVKLHEKYGGIVPEIASRAHIEQIGPIVEEALAQANCTYDDLEFVAVTAGPGLIGSLLIGVTFAKTLALTRGLPLVPVDHIEAHAVSAALVADTPPWPAVALVVSGGHTSLYLVRDFDDITLLGQTVDDAAGEAFDKVAALLELGYPGGPIIDKLAQEGNPRAIDFPRPWIREPHANFSFSGLKTAVLYRVCGVGRKYAQVDQLTPQELADVVASFQAAVVDTLVTKTVAAAQRAGVQNVVVGGGVAANSWLRRDLQAACTAAGLTLHLTPMKYCTDNAAMVGALGHFHFERGVRADLTLEPRGGLVRPRSK